MALAAEGKRTRRAADTPVMFSAAVPASEGSARSRSGARPFADAGPRVEFCGMSFDRVTIAQAAAWIGGRGAEDAFAYVVTPNADHVVRFASSETTEEIRRAYSDADLCICDSRVLALLAALRHKDLHVSPGSDLVVALLGKGLGQGKKLALIGGEPSSPDLLARHVPGVEIAWHGPPMALATNPAAIRECVEFVLREKPDYILIAVGSPQQELVAHAIALEPSAGGTALCIGSGLDFFTGRRRRAPRWMQVLALEWLHRLLSDPRRMWRRYLVRCPKVLWIALRD